MFKLLKIFSLIVPFVLCAFATDAKEETLDILKNPDGSIHRLIYEVDGVGEAMVDFGYPTLDDAIATLSTPSGTTLDVSMDFSSGNTVQTFTSSTAGETMGATWNANTGGFEFRIGIDTFIFNAQSPEIGIGLDPNLRLRMSALAMKPQLDVAARIGFLIPLEVQGSNREAGPFVVLSLFNLLPDQEKDMLMVEDAAPSPPTLEDAGVKIESEETEDVFAYKYRVNSQIFDLRMRRLSVRRPPNELPFRYKVKLRLNHRKYLFIAKVDRVDLSLDFGNSKALVIPQRMIEKLQSDIVGSEFVEDALRASFAHVGRVRYELVLHELFGDSYAGLMPAPLGVAWSWTHSSSAITPITPTSSTASASKKRYKSWNKTHTVKLP